LSKRFIRYSLFLVEAVRRIVIPMVATVASDALQRPSSSLRGRRSWRGALVFGLGFTTLSKLGDASRCTEAASYNFDVVDVGGGGWHGKSYY